MENPFIPITKLVSALKLDKPSKSTDLNIKKACVVSRLMKYEEIKKTMDLIPEERLTKRSSNGIRVENTLFAKEDGPYPIVERLAMYEDMRDHITDYSRKLDDVPGIPAVPDE